MRILPVNGKSFVDLQVLAGFDTPAAKNTLLRIVTVERVGVIFFVRFGMIRNGLMLHGQQFFSVVNGAISVVVVAYGAVEIVIGENTIERLQPCRLCPRRFRQHLRIFSDNLRAGALQLPVDFQGLLHLTGRFVATLLRICLETDRRTP